jgi:hypothetical protein
MKVATHKSVNNLHGIPPIEIDSELQFGDIDIFISQIHHVLLSRALFYKGNLFCLSISLDLDRISILKVKWPVVFLIRFVVFVGEAESDGVESVVVVVHFIAVVLDHIGQGHSDLQGAASEGS